MGGGTVLRSGIGRAAGRSKGNPEALGWRYRSRQAILEKEAVSRALAEGGFTWK